MNIQIPSANITPLYNAGSPTFPEAWFTINEWIFSGAIQSTGVNNGDSLYESINDAYNFTQQKLVDIFQGDGIVTNQPMALLGDLEILDLLLPLDFPAFNIPTGGAAVLPGITKLTSAGTETKTLGEWGDANWEVWKNDTTSKVMVYMNPFNGVWVDFHLVRATQLKYSTANEPTLTNNTQYNTILYMEALRATEVGQWVKLQP